MWQLSNNVYLGDFLSWWSFPVIGGHLKQFDSFGTLCFYVDGESSVKKLFTMICSESLHHICIIQVSPSFCSLCRGEQAYPQPLVTGWGSPLLLFLSSSHQLIGTRAGTWPRAITVLWGELVQKLCPGREKLDQWWSHYWIWVEV